MSRKTEIRFQDLLILLLALYLLLITIATALHYWPNRPISSKSRARPALTSAPYIPRT